MGQGSVCAELCRRMPHQRPAPAHDGQGGGIGRRHPLRPLYPLEDGPGLGDESGDPDAVDKSGLGDYQQNASEPVRGQSEVWQTAIQQNPAPAVTALWHHAARESVLSGNGRQCVSPSIRGGHVEARPQDAYRHAQQGADQLLCRRPPPPRQRCRVQIYRAGTERQVRPAPSRLRPVK